MAFNALINFNICAEKIVDDYNLKHRLWRK